MENDFRIAVIGLGIIGGSMAYALKGFRGGVLIGYDRNEKALSAALKAGAISSASSDAGAAIENADLVIIATYPDSIAKIIKENWHRFKKGAVITDVCGVKTELTKKILSVIPEGVDYVGSHPMAGKEVDGFENAEAGLFNGCGFIITPTGNSKQKSIDLVYDMAKYIGAKRIAYAEPKTHDEVIAYTSDLMHVVSSALCLDYHTDMNLAYTAGAFRDCTRVALINPELWTELFLLNKDNTVAEIDRFMKSVSKIKKAIEEENTEELEALLSKVRKNKIDILKKEPMQ